MGGLLAPVVGVVGSAWGFAPAVCPGRRLGPLVFGPHQHANHPPNAVRRLLRHVRTVPMHCCARPVPDARAKLNAKSRPETNIVCRRRGVVGDVANSNT